MGNSMEEKAKAYDKYGITKAEIEKALVLLKEFRRQFPFAENPDSIDLLKPDDIFKINPDALGEFFHYVEIDLRPLGHLTIQGSIIYHNIRLQIDDFKALLRITVDKKKSLAEKVNAHWEKISRLGQDKQVAKKIIFCFNYESGKILPIFSTAHLRHFVKKIVDKPSGPSKCYSLGEEYVYLMSELLRAKENSTITQPWEISYFSRFLYNAYPPPDQDEGSTSITENGKTRNVVTKELLSMGEFARLLQELQVKGKISGEQFRDYRAQWARQPNDRETLIQQLKKLNV
jgi:hypothetical protein